MNAFDRILIEPAPEALEDGLGEAVAAVNGKARKRRLPWPMADYIAFASTVEREREGWWQWNADGSGIRSALGVAWWTDHIGRRHLRLVGRRDTFRQDQRVFLLGGAPRPALCLVYPEVAFLRGRARLLTVLCHCGATGTPEALGWMGDCCAACHDRRESGTAVPWLRGRNSFATPSDGPPSRLVLAVSPDGSTLALGNGRETLDLWDVATGQVRFSLNIAWWLTGAAFAPHEATLATWNVYGNLQQWDLATGEKTANVPTNRDVRRLAYSPDGSLLARSGERGSILLEADSGRIRHDFRNSLSGVTCHAFSAGGEWFAAGTASGSLKVWDTRTGNEAFSRTPPQGDCFLTDLAFSSVESGSVLAAASMEQNGATPRRAAEAGRILLFARSASRCWQESGLAGHSSGTLAVAFSPDGQTLVTGGRDHTVRQWSVATGEGTDILEWHQDEVCQVIFSADGRWLVTGSDDGAVKLWPWQAIGERGV